MTNEELFQQIDEGFTEHFAKCLGKPDFSIKELYENNGGVFACPDSTFHLDKRLNFVAFAYLLGDAYREAVVARNSDLFQAAIDISVDEPLLAASTLRCVQSMFDRKYG